MSMEKKIEIIDVNEENVPVGTEIIFG